MHASSSGKRFEKLLFVPVGAILAGFFLAATAYAADSSRETIHPNSYVYRALRTFELIGLVRLDPQTPYVRPQVERYVGEIIEALEEGGVTLTPRQEFLLERMTGEYAGKGITPAERENPPLYTYQKEERYFGIEMPVGLRGLKRPERDKAELEGLLRPGIQVYLGRGVTMEMQYRIVLGPEYDENVSHERPGPRVRSWRGMTSLYERSYISFGGSSWQMRLGRDYVAWGSGRIENLLMSQSASSMDNLYARVDIGRFGLSLLHVQLDPAMPRLLAGHRLSVRMPRGIFLGISETVLYTGRQFDYAYLLPLVSYYSNQYNERTDDNITWSVDLKVPLGQGVLLYGDLLIDDLQYESEPPAPHRIAFNVTAEANLRPWGREVELLAAYTFVDIYTYAHKDSLNTHYISGAGEVNVDLPIGSLLGPDADRWRLRLSAPVHQRAVLSGWGIYSRRGEGNGYLEWSPGMEPDPPFPSGEVAKETEFALQIDVDLGRGSYVTGGGGWRNTRAAGEETGQGFAFLTFVWDF
jgi:hypothetical protein